MHNLLNNDAKRFYRTNFQDVSYSCNKGRRNMKIEYNSITHQSHVMEHLHILHLNKIMEKESFNYRKKLEKLRNIMTKFTPQGPCSHGSPEAKVIYFYEDMIGTERANNSLNVTYGSKLQCYFIRFYDSLHASWLQEKHRRKLINALKISELQGIFSKAVYFNPWKKISYSPRRKLRRLQASKNVSLRLNKRCYICLEIATIIRTVLNIVA